MDRPFEQPLPHHDLLNELQLAMVPLSRLLPIVQSMLKWMRIISHGEQTSGGLSWLLLAEHEWSLHELTLLKQSVHELSLPLEAIMENISAYQQVPSVHIALTNLYNHYKALPTINHELHILQLGYDPFEDQELVAKLLLFTETLRKVQESSVTLKNAIIDEVLRYLSPS